MEITKPTSKLRNEIEKFEAVASDWWNPNGSFKPLHKLTPLRMEYILGQIKEKFPDSQNEKIQILDIGCGGGIITECLARAKFNVTGIDASEVNIEVAKNHATTQNLTINYKSLLPEQLEKQKFDVVIALEIIEHVDNVEFFLETCYNLVAKGGLIIFSTMNKTIKSYIESIFIAEYLLKWIPTGTHNWQKFIKPSEIILQGEKQNFNLINLQGIRFSAINSCWNFSEDVSNNYFVCLGKLS